MSDEAGFQAAVQEEVCKRQQQAIEDIANKYAMGKGGIEESVNAPTGKAYAEINAKVASEKRAALKQSRIEAEMQSEKENSNRGNFEEDDDGGDDDDADLRALREQRMKALKNEQRDIIDQVGKGHGQYREIVQDDFIQEVTSSDKVIVHFYHRDFERCKVIDMHLKKLSMRHIETKFCRIDAEKTPFFTAKLVVETLPTICCFVDGVCRGKIIGYDGLTEGLSEDRLDEWPTIRLARWFAENGAMIDASKIVDDDGIEAAHQAMMDQKRKSVFTGIRGEGFTIGEDDEDDFDLDNIEDVDLDAVYKSV
jgi:hypothetical protein